MRLLDLFCGAGGAAMGYARAGFTEIVGIDLQSQPRYPFHFIQADALHPPVRLEDFDAIHASPPCQAYIRSGTVSKGHPKLIGLVRDMLVASGKPYVIENVEGAPLRPTFVLCGSMFSLAVRRHRRFEVPSVFALHPATCDHSRPITGVYGHPHGTRGAWKGMLPSDETTWSRELGIDWMTPKELAQAIPPAYTEFIGRQLLEQI